ncbi:MAG: hypothetical protein Ta2G_16540 [Termitinemataceae bacterium]|nr:MAG: hypothetical protein Ta2G_16540 [Termitinemataceae bacterium]
MNATYRINSNELNHNFLEILRNTFAGKKIAVTVEEIQDETEYLYSSAANKKHLLKALEDSKNKNGVIELTMKKMEAMIA